MDWLSTTTLPSIGVVYASAVLVVALVLLWTEISHKKGREWKVGDWWFLGITLLVVLVAVYDILKHR